MNRTVSALRDEIQAELSRRELLEFGARVYSGFEAPPHIRLMASLLEKVERGEIRRLMINIPARHAKSVTCSSIFPAWYLGRNPKKNVIIGTHSAELSERNSRLARSFIEDDRWPFETRLSADSSAVQRWNLTDGGGLYAVGTGGSVTGRGADVAILDDVTHDEGSETEREGAYRWYREVLYPRLEPRGAVIMIGTRFSETDPFGRVIEDDKENAWTVVRLPAFAEDNDPLDRPLGEALWPQRFSAAELNDRKQAMGSRAFESQFQQNPLPAAGNLIRAEWLTQRYAKAPEGLRIVMALDSAAKTGIANDASAIVVIGSDKTKHYVLDVVARRVDYPDLRRLLISMYEKWLPSKVFIEDTSNAIALIQELKRTTSMPIIPVKALGSKISRVEAISGQLESGNVILPDDRNGPPWLTEFTRELLSFPGARHDDMVDAFTLGLTQVVKRKFAFAVCVEDLPPDNPLIGYAGWPEGVH